MVTWLSGRRGRAGDALACCYQVGTASRSYARTGDERGALYSPPVDHVSFVPSVQSIPDPRSFPLREGGVAPRYPQWLGWAEMSLAAATGQEREAADALLRGAMVEVLRARQIAGIEATLNAAASSAVYRHLWRALGAAWRHIAARADTHQVIAHGFALPVVVVAAADTAIELPGILGNVPQIVELLQQHGSLAGNRNFGIANVLAGAAVLGLDAIPRWLAWRGVLDNVAAFREVAPSPIVVAPGHEGAHLRFLIGSALAAPHAALFEERTVGAWGMSLAHNLSRQLAAEGVQLLALPRAPADPLSALHQGRLAHREVALQLFATSAIRKLRADFGEPTAVISAHQPDGGAELRLSLSSPFGERDAEGFRCPLYPFDRVEDVLTMIVELLRACRVMDIRLLTHVHPDRDRQTGLTLLFRADAIGAADSVAYH